MDDKRLIWRCRRGSRDALRQIYEKYHVDLLKLAREHDAKDLAQLAGIDYSKLVNVEPLQVDDVEPLRAELQSFIGSLRSGRPPEVSAEDGVAAVELAEQIVAALKQHQWELPDR